MSKIAISGASTGTATFTIESPATSTNRTLTLPDNTGTIVTTGTTTGISASAISTGTLAAARLPAGTVLQVVNATKTDTSSTSSTSYTDTGVTATITPSTTSNKILVTICVPTVGISNDNIAYFQLQRNGTSIIESTGGGLGETNDATFTIGGQQFSPNNRQGDSLSITYLDSPSTTSAVTYKLQMKVQAGGGTMYVNRWAADNNKSSVATITLMEIAA